MSLVGFRLGHSDPLHGGAAVEAADAGAPPPTPSAAIATAIAETVIRPEDLMSTPFRQWRMLSHPDGTADSRYRWLAVGVKIGDAFYRVNCDERGVIVNQWQLVEVQWHGTLVLWYRALGLATAP
ncbi:hypothetical protein [Streptomyces bluensis]|uniref:hypothetical protein n=1 Tax=Streptomyces bluensis TaxID=33897 RepID=UPI00332B55B8